MKIRFSCIIIAAILATGCAKENRDVTSAETSGGTPPLVSLCRHINYSDTALLHSEPFMKKTMSRMIKLLPNTDSISSKEALTIFFNGLKHDYQAIEQATRIAELYLNNPASPVRNETVYLNILHSLLAVDSLPDAVRLRAEQYLRTISLNRPGSIATDFEFIDRDGINNTLHTTCGEEILLIFYDPECPHCHEILRDIATDESISESIGRGSLTVMAIYAEGKKDMWDSTKWELPKEWTVGYDLTGILDQDLYDLPAMPVLYLLDSGKRVILKDPDHRILLKRNRQQNGFSHL